MSSQRCHKRCKSTRASFDQHKSSGAQSGFRPRNWKFVTIVSVVLIVAVVSTAIYLFRNGTIVVGAGESVGANSGMLVSGVSHSALPTPVTSLGESDVSNTSSYPYFEPNTGVLVYTGLGDVGWQSIPFSTVAWGKEFLFDGRFYHIDAEGWVRVNASVEADAEKLIEADRPFEVYNWHWPEPEDLVRFVDQDNRHLFHNRAGTFQAGDRFWFQGVLYEGIVDPDDPSGRILKSTDYVLSSENRVMPVDEFAVARGDSPDEVYGSQASSTVADGSDDGRQPGNGCVVLASFRKSHDLPNGVILSRQENSVAQSGADSGGVPTDFGFAGHRYDSNTGLIYMGARYYDPKLGRFISPDPTVPEPGNPQSLNRYSYVENNPLKFIDPYGFEKVIIV